MSLEAKAFHSLETPGAVGSVPTVRPGELPVERYLAAIVAHELGNPFTALLGRLEMLEIRKGLPDGVRRDLEAMRTAGDRMHRILENLKTFSRGDTHRPQEVALAPIVEAALARFAALNPDIKLRARLPPDHVKVQADGALLEEVVVSSLSALSVRSGVVSWMEIDWGEDSEVDEISVVMRDDGRPLTEEEIARVFHPFSGAELSSWRGLVTLSYGYYIIRAWGGTFRFPRGEKPTSELCLVALP